MLLPLVFSSCNKKHNPNPDPPDPPEPIVETAEYFFYINNDKANPYQLVKDQLIHDGFIQYNYKNIPELRKGDSISFESKKGEVVTTVNPLLSANNNLYSDPNTNEYYVITTCQYQTLTFNVYKEYFNAYLSGYSVEHEYSVVYDNQTLKMEDVSDTKTRKDNWLMKYVATFKYDEEIPFYFYEDELNLATTRKVQASREENNNVYEVEDEVLGNVFLGYNFTPDATVSLLVYQNHFEVFMTGNESSTYVSLIGSFTSLERTEIRMPYNHDTDIASRTLHLDYYDKFLVSIDRSGQKPVSLGYNDLFDSDINDNFSETERSIELTCLHPGTYTISAHLEDKLIQITGTPDSVSGFYYAAFLNNERYPLAKIESSDPNIDIYRSGEMKVVANDSILAINNASELSLECERGYNNLAKTGSSCYVYVDADKAVLTLKVNKTTNEVTARLSGYEPDYAMVMFDKFNQNDTIETHKLMLNDANTNPDYEEYILTAPVSVFAYRSVYLHLDNVNVPAVLFNETTNNLELLNQYSGEYMVKSTAINVQFTARVYNYGEKYEIFLGGYDESTYFPAINLYIYDDTSSNIVRLQQEKGYIGEEGEVSYRGNVSIAAGQHFAFIHFDGVPYYIDSWETSNYFSVIEETYNYFLCEKDIEDAEFFVRIKTTVVGDTTTTYTRFFIA